MTAGAGEIPIKNFEDVIHNGYKVVTNSGFYRDLLASAGSGSAKNQVYKEHLENKELWKNSKDPTAGYRQYDFLRKISGVWTPQSGCTQWCKDNLETPIPSKTLLYATSNFMNPSSSREYNQIIGPLFALNMNDEVKLPAAHALQKDSEFLPIFNHYLRKQFENGLIYFSVNTGGRTRTGSRSYGPKRKEFGMTEPEALPFNSVQFAFMFLGGAIITSMVIAVCESIFEQIAMKSRTQSQETDTPLDEKPKLKTEKKETNLGGFGGF